MIKPIFLVGIPIDQTNKEELSKIQQMLENKITDYHCIVYTRKSSDDVDFKVFYEKDFDEIKFEELKNIVRSNI